MTRGVEGRESLHTSDVFQTAFKDARPAERGKANTALARRSLTDLFVAGQTRSLASVAGGTLLLMVIGFARVDALTIAPMTFEELVREASAVVYARVAEVRGQWTQDRRSIDSLVTLDALHYLKGDFGRSVLMRLPGGEAGGIVQVLPGAPVVREGDLVVLFLAARGPSIPAPVGLNQGVFRVAHDSRTGQSLVSPPPLKGSTAGRVLRGAADRRALTLEAFEASIRDLGAAH